MCQRYPLKSLLILLIVVNREKDDIVNGNKVEDIIVYINRLDIARRYAEKRIEALGGPAYPKVQLFHKYLQVCLIHRLIADNCRHILNRDVLETIPRRPRMSLR
jgi:hypothetical protein